VEQWIRNGEPFLFECHVLCCTKIDDLIVCYMIINIQCRNKHLFLIFFASLVCLFLLIILLLQTIHNKKNLFFTIKKPYHLPYEFCQCGIFYTFIFFFLGKLMKQSNDNELKVNVLGGHGLQTHDQVIKR
jgi:hypothetical protein